MIEFRPLNNLSVHLDHLIKGRLWLKVIIGLALGAGVGVLLNPSTGLLSENISLRLADWLDLPGKIFETGSNDHDPIDIYINHYRNCE